ncbi:unnamed protein product [Darwinula stevensoni]|uniref:CARD domain-containing protein n=1 Tax=Darwinula stevensoni TaxID=69355 RepID=A0A7R9AAS2_9CRUS|nr:unnamed protein product [Darwinula stevensoni]CAG0898387.1 unnamed protein product [Darwinula stevensoni]
MKLEERIMAEVANVLARNFTDLTYIEVDLVLNDLQVDGIIWPYEYNENSGEKTTTMEKVLFLQKVLPKKGDESFPKFIDILRRRNYGKLANKMEEELRKLQNGEDNGPAEELNSNGTNATSKSLPDLQSVLPVDVGNGTAS